MSVPVPTKVDIRRLKEIDNSDYSGSGDELAPFIDRAGNLYATMMDVFKAKCTRFTTVELYERDNGNPSYGLTMKDDGSFYSFHGTYKGVRGSIFASFPAPPPQHLNLHAKRYVTDVAGDINLARGEVLSMLAPTNCGKSFFARHYGGKVVIAMPSLSTLGNLVKSARAEGLEVCEVWGETKAAYYALKEDPNIIMCSWNQIPYIRHKRDYTLFVDEFHKAYYTTVTTETVAKMLDTIPLYKNAIIMSGTMRHDVNLTAGIATRSITITNDEVNNVELCISRSQGMDILEPSEKTLQVYAVNDTRKGYSLADCVFHAADGERGLKQLHLPQLLDGVLDKDVRKLAITQYAVEGYEINNEYDLVVINISAIGDFRLPMNWWQLALRFRNAKRVIVNIVRGKEWKKSEFIPGFDVNKAKYMLREKPVTLAKMRTQPYVYKQASNGFEYHQKEILKRSVEMYEDKPELWFPKPLTSPDLSVVKMRGKFFGIGKPIITNETMRQRLWGYKSAYPKQILR